MKLRKVYVDSSVLQHAARNKGPLGAAARKALEEPADVEWFFSVFVELETIAKLKHHGFKEQLAYLEPFLEDAQRVRVSPELLDEAFAQACRDGTGPLDAVHLALAARAGCHFLLTDEKSDRSIYRGRALEVRSVEKFLGG